MGKYRTHTVAEISEDLIGQTVTVAGFIDTVRDHGGVQFVDLRDHYGIVQVALRTPADTGLRRETAVSVTGRVLLRDKETVNPKIATGTVEIVPEGGFRVLGKVYEQLPFEIGAGSADSGEDARLRYRFLDLRRAKPHGNIVTRSLLFSHARKVMESGGFLEIQTPILSASSPEGARDYLVPSRKHKGSFYALPQAPQVWKQLLMTSGFDKYFQIAPCFRDEDARADRTAGEFYQLDLEMSFADSEDVFKVAESVIPAIISKFTDKPVDTAPFQRITYREAIEKYGSDKPDLRNPLTVADLTKDFAGSSFKPFADKTVRGIRVPKMGEKSKTFFKSMEEYALSIGMKGLGYVVLQEDGTLKGPIDKFLTDESRASIKAVSGLETDDVLYFIADSESNANKFAGLLRNEIAERCELIDDSSFRICWIVDFPMFESEENKVSFGHNPFSMPKGGMDALNGSNPLDITAEQYDLVINGVELASGAVRNHDPEVMLKAFEIAGLSEDVVKEIRQYRFTQERVRIFFGQFETVSIPHPAAVRQFRHLCFYSCQLLFCNAHIGNVGVGEVAVVLCVLF
ncbi:aspartate--tRNA ligase [Clostridia bacterium]|nr:aspartate--tRNA ligase [Clostridia bacterium]